MIVFGQNSDNYTAQPVPLSFAPSFAELPGINPKRAEASANAKHTCAEQSEASANAKHTCAEQSEASDSTKHPCAELAEASDVAKQPCAELAEASASIWVG